MSDLSVERIFSSPALSGKILRDARFSPDGQRVTYLQGKANDQRKLDLWEYRIFDGKRALLVDSAALVANETVSEEEQARRERQRIDATGIIEYQWSPASNALLFPLGGHLYLYDLKALAVKRLTTGDVSATDVRFSPLGSYVSYVHGQNLYVIDLASGVTKRLTKDGGGSVTYAAAEFVAQEEMHRSTGYWWAPDETSIAYTRVDEAGVEVARRFEVYADRLDVYDQRYPRAGTANALVELMVQRLPSRGEPTTGMPVNAPVVEIDLGPEKDTYLARVTWCNDSTHLLVQRQSRDQKRLEVLSADVTSGQSSVLFVETDSYWINLGGEPQFLKDSEAFLWTSESSGFRHIYLYANDGHLLRTLTQGEWAVKDLVSVDEAKGLVYFTGFAKSPLELHLYATPLEGGPLQQITVEAGWHEPTFAKGSGHYLDRYSSAVQPPQVSLHTADGAMVTYLEENRLDDTHPLYPYQAAMVRPQFGHIAADDGTPLYFRLYRPRTIQGRHPAIVFVYGGPHAQLVTNAWSGDNGYWAQVLAAKGFVVFQLDNRGSFNRGKTFESHLYRNMGDAEVRDQRAGAEFLRSLPFVDGERIGMFGWSYGGYMTMRCMLKEPEIFKAGVAVAPVSDWRLYDTHYTERYLGHPNEDAAAYERSSLLQDAKNLKGDLLLVHGMADDNVLFTHSTKMYQAFQEHGVPFSIMTYPGSKHGLWGESVRKHLYQGMTAHFERALGKAQP